MPPRLLASAAARASSGVPPALPILLGVGLVSVPTFVLLLYLLLETKQRWILPQSWWRPISTLCFWPMLLPSLLKRRLGGQKQWSDVGEGVLCGATPLVCAGHVNELHRDGVRAVVNLQAEYAGPVGAYARCVPPITQLHLPTTDHLEPSLDDMETAVEFIGRHRAAGERVLVHCKGGHGRSAAICAAWLIYSEKLTPEGAQRRLSSARKVRKTLFKQPALLSFYVRHGQQRAGGASTEAVDAGTFAGSE